MSDWFERRSPALCAVILGIPIIATCFIQEWYLSAMSLALAVTFASLLAGPQKVFGRLKGLAVLFTLIVLSNPFISHRGSRILLFVNGVPVTWEAIEYGLNLGFMITAAVIWCMCWDHVMTESRISRLTGIFSPSAALVLSMSLRLIPLYLRRWENMRAVQVTSGGPGKKNMISKAKDAVICFSGLLTWAIERSRTTSVSMVSRGACLKRKRRLRR